MNNKCIFLDSSSLELHITLVRQFFVKQDCMQNAMIKLCFTIVVCLIRFEITVIFSRRKQ